MASRGHPPGEKGTKTMSKTKIESDPVASALNSLAGQIKSPVLSKADRQRLKSRSDKVPDQLIEMISDLAEQNGGQVLGMAFDAATARTTLTQTSATRTQISTAKQLTQKMEDDMIQQRVAVADPAFAIFTALRRLVNTKAGNSLAPAYEQMKTIVKDRPRTPRKKKTATTATATAPAPQGGATATATPQPSAPAPTAKAASASTSN
jgi:hypothetical protein